MAVLAIAVHNLGVEQEYLELTAEAVRSFEQASTIARNHLGADQSNRPPQPYSKPEPEPEPKPEPKPEPQPQAQPQP